MSAHDLHADATLANSAELDRRVLESKARARRRWMLRSLLTLTLTFIVGLWFVVSNYNQDLIARTTRELEVSAQQLQKVTSELGWLPAVMPQVPSNLRYYAEDEADRYFALHSGEPAIIAYTTPQHLFLRENGQGVIVYDEGRVYAKWMSESDLKRKLREQMARLERFEEIRSQTPPLP